MVEPIGKQLAKARLARGMSVDEAAHATKMRPDKILALENDDYARFGNNAYAKGFLQIYGRFLGVDVTRQFQELETAPTLNVADYQYLNSAPEPVRTPVRAYRRDEARPPSIAPLLVLVAFFGAAFFVFWIYVNTERLGLNKGHVAATTTGPTKGTASTQADQSSSPTSREETSTESAQKQPAGQTLANASSIAGGAPAPHSDVTPANLPQTSVTPDSVEVRRAEALPAGPKRPEAITPSGGVNEIVVEPIRKTWVTIRKGSPDSTPIFEDFLYPGPSLKLRGTKFFVEVRDQTAVQIRKNGNPIAYQAPGISIQ